MKKLLLFVCALVVAGALSAQTKTVLTVENIHCGHCVNNVTQLIGGVEGVEMVKVDIAKKEVAVEYNKEKTTPCKIVGSLKDTKYQVVKIDGKEIKDQKSCCKEGEKEAQEVNKETQAAKGCCKEGKKEGEGCGKEGKSCCKNKK